MTNLSSKFAKANLNVVRDEVLPLIKINYAQLAAASVLDKLNATVDVVTDEDPSNNQEQLKLIWGHITADPQLAEAFRLAIIDAANKINEPTVSSMLTALANPITQTLVAVSDENPANADQLKAIWKEFIKSPEFLALVLSNLDIIVEALIKNKNAAAWIEKILKTFITKN